MAQVRAYSTAQAPSLATPLPALPAVQQSSWMTNKASLQIHSDATVILLMHTVSP